MTDGHDHDDMVTWDAAAGRVRSLRGRWLERLGTIEVGVEDIAGRTLAAPIDAPADVPARSHATMDGFAFDATRDYPLDVADADVFPEDDPPAVDAGQAVRIATGAPLPPSANAVLKREEATVDDGQLTGTDRVRRPESRTATSPARTSRRAPTSTSAAATSPRANACSRRASG